jgi:ferredoxin
MPKVIFVNEKTEIEVPEGAILREEARKAGVELHKGMERYLNCRGHGLCGTCRVLVKKGGDNLTPRTLVERFNLATHPVSMLASLGHEEEMRLACQARVKGDCAVETQPGFNWAGENFWAKPYPNK